MKPHPRLIWFLVFLLITGVSVGMLIAERAGWLGKRDVFYLSDRLSRLNIQDTGGVPTVRFEHNGQDTEMTADVFLREVAKRQAGNASDSLLYRVFDITSWTGILWVGFGLLAQAMFTGRMVIQWICSEKAKQSVVPEAFWWLSLIGSTMLLIYFFWRVEIVGLIGQATGWAIYVRNLYFIHINDRRPQAA